MTMDPSLSRRAFGWLMLGAASAGAAGCVRATPEGNGQEEGTSARNPDGLFHGAWPFTTPPTGHFNYAPGLPKALSLGMYHEMMLVAGGMWDWGAGEWLYLLAEGHDFDEKRFTYKIKPDLTWSDGSPITSADVEATFWVRWLMNQPEWSMVSGLKAQDDLTVVFDLSDPATTLDRMIMKAPILYSSVYGEFGERAKKLQEAGESTDSKAANALREDLQSLRPESGDLLWSGPFTMDVESITDARVTLVKNDKGLLADQVAFKTIHVHSGETNDISPLVLDGTIDYATHAFAISTQKQWEDNGLRTLKPAIYSGTSILFSMGRRPELGDRRVRQAFAHAVDREEAGVIAFDESAKPSATMSGMPGLLDDEWLDDETRAQLNAYELDLDRAAALLEDAGWSRKKQRWMTPDGKDAEYQITFQSDFANSPPAAQYYAEKLTDFGIRLELDGIESANMSERISTGRFDLAFSSWGGGEVHPHFSYTAAFINSNEPIARNMGGRGMDYDLVREIEGMGSVDIQKMITQSGQGLDEDNQRKLINQLALIFNAEMPLLPIWERFGNNPAQEGTRVKAFPPDDDPIWQSAAYTDNPVVLSLYRGTIVPS